MGGFSGSRGESDAIVLGGESPGNGDEGRPDSVFVIGEGEDPQEALAFVEEFEVFGVFGPEVNFGAIGRTDAAFALEMNFAFAAPEPVARAAPVSGPASFSFAWSRGLAFFIDFGVKAFVQSDGEGFDFLRSGGEEDEEKAFHGEQGAADGEVVEPAGRSRRLGHGAGGLVAFPPDDDADDEGGHGEADA